MRGPALAAPRRPAALRRRQPRVLLHPRPVAARRLRPARAALQLAALPAAADTVTAEQGTDLTFHMITHSDDGPFWSVVQRGMDAGVRGPRRHRACGWRRTTTPSKQVPGLIEQAVSPRVPSGIASALASPDQLDPAAAGCCGCRHPGDHAQLGARTTTRRSARSRTSARPSSSPVSGAGERFNDARCDQDPVRTSGRVERGARGALRRPRRHVRGRGRSREFVGLDADQTGAAERDRRRPSAPIPTIDGFMGTGPVIADVGPATPRQDAGTRADGHRRLRHHAGDHRRHRGRRRSPSPSTSSSTCRATCRSCSCTCTSPTRTSLAAVCRSSPARASSTPDERRLQVAALVDGRHPLTSSEIRHCGDAVGFVRRGPVHGPAPVLSSPSATLTDRRWAGRRHMTETVVDTADAADSRRVTSLSQTAPSSGRRPSDERLAYRGVVPTDVHPSRDRRHRSASSASGCSSGRSRSRSAPPTGRRTVIDFASSPLGIMARRRVDADDRRRVRPVRRAP